MTLLIKDLTLFAIIGILPHEREKPQKILINAEFEYQYQDKFLDYVEIVDFLKKEFQFNAYGLLEEALEDLRIKIKKQFPAIEHLILSIQKPDILSDCILGAKIQE